MRNLENPLALDELIAEAMTRYSELLNSERTTVAKPSMKELQITKSEKSK